MLEEKIGYLDDLPISVRIVTIHNYPLHYHYDHEFIYVLKGFVTLKCGSSIYKMQQGDIFISNEGEVHGIYDCSNDNVVLLIQINTLFFKRQFPALPNNVYRTMRKEKSNEEIIVLRNLLLKIAMNYIAKRPGYKIINTNIMVDVLKFCDNNFKSFYFEGRIVMHKKYAQPEIGERIGRTIDYIYKHHNEKLTLRDLAEKEHFSEWHMSKMITAGTGLGFRELLAFARVEESEKILLNGSEKISRVAAKVGFSTTAYYEQFFKKWFGCHPEEYRKMYSNRIKGNAAELVFELDRQEAEDIVENSIYFLSLDVGEKAEKLKYRELNVNLEDEKVNGYWKHSIMCVENDHISNSIYNIDRMLLLIGAVHLDESYEKKAAHEQYAKDSIIVIPYLMKQALSNEEFIVPVYSNSDEKASMLNGIESLFTSYGIPKSMYHGLRIVKLLEGELLSYSDFHIATRKPEEKTLSILFFNTDESLNNLCEKSYCGMRKVQDAIDIFNTEALDVRANITGVKAGIYQIIESSYDNKNSLFYFAYKNNFARQKMTAEDVMTMIEMTSPQIAEKEAYFNENIELKYNLKGCSCKFIRIIEK